MCMFNSNKKKIFELVFLTYTVSYTNHITNKYNFYFVSSSFNISYVLTVRKLVWHFWHWRKSKWKQTASIYTKRCKDSRWHPFSRRKWKKKDINIFFSFHTTSLATIEPLVDGIDLRSSDKLDCCICQNNGVCEIILDFLSWFDLWLLIHNTHSY